MPDDNSATTAALRAEERLAKRTLENRTEEESLVAVRNALAEMQHDADEDEAKGYTVGPVRVTLVINLPPDSTTTPTDAVDKMIIGIARRGHSGFFYEVEEIDSGRKWVVRDNQVLTEDDVAYLINASREVDENKDEDEEEWLDRRPFASAKEGSSES